MCRTPGKSPSGNIYRGGVDLSPDTTCSMLEAKRVGILSACYVGLLPPEGEDRDRLLGAGFNSEAPADMGMCPRFHPLRVSNALLSQRFEKV